jgi:hypothetical protein
VNVSSQLPEKGFETGDAAAERSALSPLASLGAEGVVSVQPAAMNANNTAEVFRIRISIPPGDVECLCAHLALAAGERVLSSANG